MAENKPFCISKWAVLAAWTKVRDNKGAAGVDGVSVEDFEGKLQNNLYRVWNRMSSGSYMPPPVQRVMIPKGDGGQRPLGIPTVGDRVAQMVVKMELEPKVEPLFHPDSYGYRPGKSALDAVGTCRKRCWRYDWVVDLDIRGFFDNIDHSLMMHAVRKHTDSPWMLLYIERWLKAPAEAEDGTLIARGRGTPQGGVISPLLANIFLHHVFDAWISREYPGCPFERYADDVVIHCSSHEEALKVKAAVEARLRECRLEAHPDKTRIVYCRGDRRPPEQTIPVQFDFLSYSFRPRMAKARNGRLFTGYLPAISRNAAKAITGEIRSWKLHRKSDKELSDLSRMFNPKIRGWIAYFGRYYRSALTWALRPLQRRLARWAQRKYKRFRSTSVSIWQWLIRLGAITAASVETSGVGVVP
ncbi:MAG TPA: group II intron reverse transcriptase/maturase [Gemmata sp.]|nr:group II intron reverse transcriptase/maturase [Gemmata sp.]